MFQRGGNVNQNKNDGNSLLLVKSDVHRLFKTYCCSINRSIKEVTSEILLKKLIEVGFIKNVEEDADV